MEFATETAEKIDGFRQGGTNMKNGYRLPFIELFEQGGQ